MQLGLIGLGKMGGNMAERVRRAGHEVVGYDRAPGKRDVDSLEGLVKALQAPRVVWVMVPAGGKMGGPGGECRAWRVGKEAALAVKTNCCDRAGRPADSSNARGEGPDAREGAECCPHRSAGSGG